MLKSIATLKMTSISQVLENENQNNETQNNENQNDEDKKENYLSKKLVIDYDKKIFTRRENDYLFNQGQMSKKNYPDKVPVIIRCSNNFNLEKRKYLVSNILTVGEFMIVLKRNVKDLKPSEGLFFLVDNKSPRMTDSISLLYREYKDPENNILFITITKENVFGNF